MGGRYGILGIRRQTRKQVRKMRFRKFWATIPETLYEKMLAHNLFRNGEIDELTTELFLRYMEEKYEIDRKEMGL